MMVTEGAYLRIVVKTQARRRLLRTLDATIDLGGVSCVDALGR